MFGVERIVLGFCITVRLLLTLAHPVTSCGNVKNSICRYPCLHWTQNNKKPLQTTTTYPPISRSEQLSKHFPGRGHLGLVRLDGEKKLFCVNGDNYQEGEGRLWECRSTPRNKKKKKLTMYGPNLILTWTICLFSNLP